MEEKLGESHNWRLLRTCAKLVVMLIDACQVHAHRLLIPTRSAPRVLWTRTRHTRGPHPPRVSPLGYRHTGTADILIHLSLYHLTFGQVVLQLDFWSNTQEGLNSVKLLTQLILRILKRLDLVLFPLVWRSSIAGIPNILFHLQFLLRFIELFQMEWITHSVVYSLALPH